MARRLPLDGKPYDFVVVVWLPEWWGPPLRWRKYQSLAIAKYRARRVIRRPRRRDRGPRLVWIEKKGAPAS